MSNYVKICAVGLIVLGMTAITRAGHSSMPPQASTPRMIAAKPGQLAVSPSGDRVAVTDQFNNRIHILNTGGELLWSAGDGLSLVQPTALVFVSDKELVFSQWDSRVLCRVSEHSARAVDTVIDLTEELGGKAHILRLCRLRNRSLLVLSENPDKLVRFDPEWKQPRVLIEGGSRKGRLGHATSVAEMGSGKLVVIGHSLFPVQFFDSEGRPLVSADWNNPQRAGSWYADALAVDLRDLVWVGEAATSRCRLFDQTGTQLREMQFENPTFQPADMAVTLDNRLFAVSANGWLEIYDLGQEY
jgi:hypothetical protein